MATSLETLTLTPEMENLTVELYIRQECERYMKKLHEHTQEQINSFKNSAEKTKRELRELMTQSASKV